eukprot:scaffold11869_cov30-Tisochrysis_lutea.AAC.5
MAALPTPMHMPACRPASSSTEDESAELRFAERPPATAKARVSACVGSPTPSRHAQRAGSPSSRTTSEGNATSMARLSLTWGGDSRDEDGRGPVAAREGAGRAVEGRGVRTHNAEGQAEPPAFRPPPRSAAR